MKTRYNSFNLIHKGLRTMLYSTAIKIQQANLGLVSEGMPVIEDVELLLMLFDTHAHSEDTFFNEPLEKSKPEVAALFEEEHEEDHRLANILTSVIDEWRAAVDEPTRSKLGQQLFFAFNEFIAFNLYHMNKEEIALNKALWETFLDEEIIDMEQRVVQNLPPQKMGEYSKWMLRGNNDKDIEHWITGIKNNAPREVYHWIHGLAKQELNPVRFLSIMTNIDKLQEEKVPVI